MLDITQLNSFLPSRAAGGISKPEALLHVLSPSDCTLVPAVVNPKPMVTWQVTRSSNTDGGSFLYPSRPRRYESELSTAEGLAVIRDLANRQVRRLQFSGGEPLPWVDLLQWVAYARECGIQPSLLTNSTLLSPTEAAGLVRAGLHSVSIAMEGTGHEVDCRRDTPSAFDTVVEGFANCEAAGLVVEIRIPLNRRNYGQLAHILDFVELQRIRRVVFAHLVYAGRSDDPLDDLTHEQKRHAVDLILARAENFHRRGLAIGIATDDNHADGIYYCLQLARRNTRRAAAAYRLLPAYAATVQGAGVGSAGIDAFGDVHPDRYWANYVLGNVREKPFGEIWSNSKDPLLQGLRDRLPLLKGRCAKCRWKAACGGNSRVRAEAILGDPWMSDPACYLTTREIDKEVIEQVEAMEDDVLLEEQAA